MKVSGFGPLFLGPNNSLSRSLSSKAAKRRAFQDVFLWFPGAIPMQNTRRGLSQSSYQEKCTATAFSAST
uniref:Uncharacterized protein n=1 Tax=Anguilla anguilla TaxID=7936 RepID=A0A0E9U6J3_ANGAN